MKKKYTHFSHKMSRVLMHLTSLWKIQLISPEKITLFSDQQIFLIREKKIPQHSLSWKIKILSQQLSVNKSEPKMHEASPFAPNS